MTPRQKCHKLWHYFRFRPRISQRTHILQVAGAEAFDAGELDLKIVGEPIDHLRAPAFCRVRMSRPMDQKSRMSSRLTAKAART